MDELLIHGVLSKKKFSRVKKIKEWKGMATSESHAEKEVWGGGGGGGQFRPIKKRVYNEAKKWIIT